MGSMGETRRDRHTKPRKLSEATPNSGAQESRATALEAATVLTTKNTQLGKDDGHQTSAAKKQDIVPTRQLKLRLFVGGLGPTVGPKDLQDRLAPLGQVSGIQMIDSKEGGGDGTHRGFAFVDFEAFSDASLQKLFSAYNGCKWKGGVLRVEKAKEHYTNRLSREWAEAEVAKAKVMETQLQPDLINAGNLGDKTSKGSAAGEIPFLLTEPLKISVPFSKKVRLVPPKGTGRHKRSFQYFPSLPIGELAQESSPQFAAKRQKLVQLQNFQHESGYAMNECAVNDAEQDAEVDEIAVDVARERTRQLKLLQNLFPDDNEDTRAEEEKYVDFLQIPNVSQQSNDNASQEKIVIEKPSEHHVKAQDLPARNTKEQSQKEEDSKQIANQKVKECCVSIVEEGDAVTNHIVKDSKLITEENHQGEPTERMNVTKFVQPILKKTQNEPQAVKNHKNLPQDGEDEGEDEDEDKDEDDDSLDDDSLDDDSLGDDSLDDSSSSRSPTPEGNLSELGKWLRLFKHASVKNGQDVPVSSGGMFTGISLDDDEDDSSESSSSEESSEFSSDEDVDPELKSASGIAAKIRKWENMFKSATSVRDKSSRGENTCEVVISNAGQITEEKAIIPIASKKEDAGGDGGDDSEYASDLQKKGDNVGGNLLARFETEGMTSELSKSPTLQAGSPQQGQGKDEGEIDPDHQMSTSAMGEGSNSNLLGKENQVATEGSTWVQRATWKSLLGVDGRAAFSLKQVTGECDNEIVTRKEAEEPEATTTEQPFTFKLNLARTQSDSPKAVRPPHNPVIAKTVVGSTSSGRTTKEKKEDTKAGVSGVDGCVYMKSTTAEMDWRASKSELRMDSKAKHKCAVRAMKKLRRLGGAR